MAPQYAIHCITDPEYINFLNYLVKRTENVKSPMSINQLVRDFKDKSGAGQAYESLRPRIFDVRKRIHSFPHINKKAKVKLLFALSASVDAVFLKELKKDALVKVDEKLRIAHYKSNDGSLELRGDQSLSARMKIRSETTKFESKQSLRSWVYSYFKNKNDSNAVPKNEQEKEMGNLIEFITEKCENADSPLNIHQVTNNFIKKFGISPSFYCIYDRVKRYCNEIQNIEFINTHTKVRQLFCLSAKLNLEHLKKLRKTAVVEVDQKNRIIKYTANDGSLTLRGRHWGSKTAKPRRIEKKNKKIAVMSDDSEEESGHEGLDDSSDEYSSEEFGSEFDSDEENDLPDETNDLTKPSNETDHFDNETPVGNRSPTDMSIGDNFDFDLPTERSHPSKETEMREDDVKDDPEITGNGAVKTRYGRLSKRRQMDSGFSYKQANPSSSEVPMGTDSLSSNSAKQKKNAIQKKQASRSSNQSRSSSRSMRKSTRNSSFPSIPTDSEEKIENQDAQRAVDFDNDRSMRNDSPTEMSIDNNFDFDPSTERSRMPEETKMINDDEKEDPEITENAVVKPQRSDTRPKGKTSSSTTHIPKTPKRKADESAESRSSKRTKSPSDKSMNPGEMDNNSFHDDPPRIELKPFRGLLGLSQGTEKDADIQQIPKPHPQVEEAPIKKEYEEEAQTLLKTVFKSFKSLILGLDTTGLSQLQMELDTKIEKTGSGVEVSNKKVIMAMELLVVKLSKHGALKSSEDSISLRDVLLMLRMIILNSSFKGLDNILKMLKENIDQLKVMDKKVSVSKVDSVLRATIDSIST